MVRLRKLEPTDLPFLYQWENDAAAWRDGDTHNPLSQQDLRAYIESTTGDIYRDGQLRLIVEEQSGNAAESVESAERKGVRMGEAQSGDGTLTVGCVDLFDLDIRNRKAAVGIYIAPDRRGQGLGKEAVRLIGRYAFDVLHLRLLYAHIGAWNTPCQHLFRRLGYKQVALLPHWTEDGDVFLYSIMN